MNKKSAPIIVVGILTLYLLGYLTLIFTGMLINIPDGIKVVLGFDAVIIMIVIAALIYTLIMRLKEIDKEKDIMAGFKTMVGGELTSYTEMMNEARALGTKRMLDEAKAMEQTQLLIFVTYRVPLCKVLQK